MIAAVAAVVLVAVAAIAAMMRQQSQYHAHVQRLLDMQAQERQGWARERWELNTRIQSPELARMAPPAPPAPSGEPADSTPDEDDVDESHLVGTGPGTEA